MQRLTAIDAQFLYGEEMIPAAHQHTLKVSIYEGGAEYSFDRAKEQLRARLHRLPPFRWKLVEVPFRLHHPVWIEDPAFDFDWHVRRIAVPAPGGPKELSDLIADITSRPLDRTHPLWELYLVEGLEGGQIASVCKLHHALADGISSAELLDLFHDAEPAVEATPPAEAWRPEPVPSKLSLVLSAIVDVVRLLIKGLPTLVKAGKAVKQHKEVAGLELSSQPPKPFKAPVLHFNRIITPHRSFAMGTFSLDDVKSVRAAFGCTVNDVFLAAVSGGLRQYLDDHGELPAVPLVATVPVSTRGADEAGTWGNRLATMYTHMRTDVSDPIERLRAQQEAAAVSKAEFAVTRGARLENWIEVMPLPVLRGIIRLFRRLNKAGAPPSANLIVSNVPGPRNPLYAGRSKMTAFFSVGPISVGVGLNITVWSYVDQFNICLIACREAIPDLWKLSDAIRDSIDELVKAAGAHTRE
jgi:WS/DGAT/MGAT family acyltransferase